MVGKVLSLR